MKHESKRATYIDVKQSQLDLLKIVDDCIEKNRILTAKEREKYFKTLSDSTLGLGTSYPFLLKGKNQSYKLGHMEHAAMWIAYRKNSAVTFEGETVQISNLWKELRDILFQVFPHAKTLSLKISQEQIKLNRSTPEDV